MNYNLMNLLEGSYYIFLLWAFCIFIAWYFFRHTKKKYRAGFVKTISIISILFFFILSHNWYKNRPPFQPVRIAIFPFLKQSVNSEVLSWESLAISEIPAANINQVNPQSLLSYNLDWMRNAVNLDSLAYPFYIKNFSRRVNFDYAVFGKIKKQSSEYKIDFQVINIGTDAVIVNNKIKINSYEIVDFCDTLSNKILANLAGLNGRTNFVNKWHSVPHLENYFDSKLHLVTGQTEPAFDFAKRAVQQDSSSVLWLNFLAELFIKSAVEKKNNGLAPLDDFQSAKTLLLKALTFQENSASFHLLGELYLANEKWSLAENYLRKSFNLNSMEPSVYLALTQLHPARYADLDFKNETELIKRAIYINPCYFEAYLTLANRYSLKNRYRLALNLVNEVLRINPVYVEGLMSLGKIYLSQNKILNSLETYQKVIELAPNNGDVYYNLGIVYNYQKDYENAIKFFERAIEINDHLDSRLYLAYIYERMGEMDKAIEYLQARIRKRKNKKDLYAEEARKHLFKIMSARGVIDSLMLKSEKLNK